ncbi:amidohydrolase/deacetylase family metallohydrolase [Phytohabitans sp. ZYX-F-186]|uniref:Amidohydrolase/deacetylase family metallohydrolase n=1 Tax=Phytohabitans maris TaxID=3071409 RepID=A0ABU0Z9C1_9ACTN|nr:amidohydrolase/deacetylase family metallohydrolase [Phytohabitans sp. ZYX-F-186]MDQ7903629.1 amidohydrolase/deacetylase family metallohydrolase [Phytohabitans sp. ZYX-F-186]
MTDLDLLLTGGRLLDLDTGATAPVTVGVAGDRIAHLAPAAPERPARRTVDLDGALVLPGLVDLHTHVYRAGSRLGITADRVAARSGVTTWVDAGTAGAGTIEGLVRDVVERAAVRIRPFLNLSYIGLAAADMPTREIGELWDPRLADLAAVLRAGRELPGAIRGVKLRASANACGDSGPVVLPIAREAADALGVPLMVHLGMAPPTLTEVLPHLRAGDILTHCFHPHPGGHVLTPAGGIRPQVREAVDRGVRLDVGHGGASLAYRTARVALDAGLAPHTISSDIHAHSISGPVPDLLRVLETFLALGLPLHEVLARATRAPADVLGEPDLGRLAVGGPADVAVLRPVDEPLRLRDMTGETLTGGTRLRHVLTVVRGRVLDPDAAGPAEGRDSPWLHRFQENDPPTDQEVIP